MGLVLRNILLLLIFVRVPFGIEEGEYKTKARREKLQISIFPRELVEYGRQPFFFPICSLEEVNEFC